MKAYTLNLVIEADEEISTLEASTDARARMLAELVLREAMRQKPGVNAYASLGRGSDPDAVEWLGAWDWDGETGEARWSPED